MTNVCSSCGSYRADKIVDVDAEIVVCPECGHRQRLRFLPLMLVGGPSGAGKSTILFELVSRDLPVVLLDADTIWSPHFDDPDSNYREFFETWLRIAKNIHQSGRSCVLFGSGAVVPRNIIPCIEARYFSRIHYLALIAEEDALRTRLLSRPAWRHTADEDFLSAQIEFARWLRTGAEAAEHDIRPVDTTHEPATESAGRVADWISEVLQLDHRSPAT